MPDSSLICSSNDITNQINNSILERTLAYGNLDVLLSPRSEPTKYVFPCNVINPPCQKKVLHYHNTETFNPGTSGAWSGYATNVHTECLLRNQLYALQKFPQANYVPNSNSELYNSNIPLNNNFIPNHPQLFDCNLVPSNSETKEKSSIFNTLGKLFNNDTRQQLKDS